MHPPPSTRGLLRYTARYLMNTMIHYCGSSYSLSILCHSGDTCLMCVGCSLLNISFDASYKHTPEPSHHPPEACLFEPPLKKSLPFLVKHDVTLHDRRPPPSPPLALPHTFEQACEYCGAPWADIAAGDALLHNVRAGGVTDLGDDRGGHRAHGGRRVERDHVSAVVIDEIIDAHCFCCEMDGGVPGWYLGFFSICATCHARWVSSRDVLRWKSLED